ncbi:MAG: Two component regulator propeller [Daejeonella sp.]|nr:Two component regulator propeller [Daejeonella sp.]
MIGSADDRFKKFQKKLDGADGETFMRFYGMCIDEKGYLWLGTDGDGIYKKAQLLAKPSSIIRPMDVKGALPVMRYFTDLEIRRIIFG